MVAKNRLCLTVKRNRSDSLPTNPVAAQATAMDWGDHLAGHAAAGVGGHQQGVVDPNLVRGGGLQ